MPVFRRRATAPPEVSAYSEYRPLVREDFQQCCAYCLVSEILAGGEENFELDHFRPKSKPEFKQFVKDFYNLYYACHVCNSKKHARWPTPELAAQGCAFVDLCADVFSTHYAVEAEGSWRPLTPSAKYTHEMLRLNRRHLREIRTLLHELAQAASMPSLDWDLPMAPQIERLLAQTGKASTVEAGGSG